MGMANGIRNLWDLLQVRFAQEKCQKTDLLQISVGVFLG